jgi:glycosyltransferase involved in cell wall biosynthesis
VKFSVLLPTRNRLEYLRYAIETVRRQDYSDWEIIVSDNCSEDDIAGYIAGLADKRIRYFRTDTFVPVTDNWNNALAQSRGDYVVMLGDDDGLLPGYFARLHQTISTFPQPDFVYVSAYFFAYPGVMPDRPQGFLRRDQNSHFPETTPFWLDADRARAIAKDYLDFRMPVASNMQFSLISRRKIEELSRTGPFFQSPYPDFFATPALFLTSSKIVIVPEPLVVIGITPKSYGFFHFNDRAIDGVKFLKNDDTLLQNTSTRSMMLPGTSYNDSWLLANEALSACHAGAYDMRPNYRRYRFLQIVHAYKRCYYDRAIESGALRPLRERMTLTEKLIYGMPFSVGFRLLRLGPAEIRLKAIRLLRNLIGQHSIRENPDLDRPYQTLLDVFEAHLQVADQRT